MKSVGYYEDHIQAVAERWKKEYKESKLTASDFIKSAKVTLTKYGWNEKEIERILKGIN